MGRLESLHTLCGAEYRPSCRLVRKRRGLHQVEHYVLGRILRRGDFLQDHVTLPRKLSALEARGKNDVAQDIQRKSQIVAQHAGVIGRRVDAGRGVQLTAYRFDLLGDGLSAAAVGALEGHMLEKMSDAVFSQTLAAATGSNPYAERDGLHIRP